MVYFSRSAYNRFTLDSPALPSLDCTTMVQDTDASAKGLMTLRTPARADLNLPRKPMRHDRRSTTLHTSTWKQAKTCCSHAKSYAETNQHIGCGHHISHSPNNKSINQLSSELRSGTQLTLGKNLQTTHRTMKPTLRTPFSDSIKLQLVPQHP